MKQNTNTQNLKIISTPGQLISLRKAAARLDISVRTLYRLMADGQIAKPFRVGGARKLCESDIAAYISKLKRLN